MPGIPHQRHARPNKGGRQRQAKRIREPTAGQLNIAKKIAEHRAQRLKKARIIARQDFSGDIAIFCPDNRRAVVLERQNGKRPGRGEKLMRSSGMGVIMINGADNACLVIVPPRAANTGPLCDLALPSVASDDQVTFVDGLPTARADTVHHTIVKRHNAALIEMSNGIMFAHRIQKGATQVAVFYHMPHGAFVDFAVIEMQKERRRAFALSPVTDLDVQYRLGMILQRRPKSQDPQKPDRRQRQRIGPAVKFRVFLPFGSKRIQHDDSHPMVRQRQRQQRPNKPATDNCYIRMCVHSRYMGVNPAIVQAWKGR